MAELGRVPAGSPPPVHLWEPTNRYAIDLCIKANGDWVHEGALIERPRLVRLLASVLGRIGEDYFLVTHRCTGGGLPAGTRPNSAMSP